MTNMSPLVSVVIPAYNRAKFIGEAVESILRQTFTRIELVIVDDGSTDETSRVAVDAARWDPRVRIVRLERNLGVSAALNVGFRTSRGRFIARLDSDDVAAPERIDMQLNAFHANDRLVAVGSHMEQFGGVPRQLIRFPLSDSRIKAHLVAAANHLSGGAMMVRRDFVEQHGISFDETLRVAEDYDYLVSIMEKGGNFSNVDSTLISYRVYSDNTSNLFAPIFREFVGRVKRRLMGIWFPSFADAELNMVTEMFAEPFAPDIKVLLNTCRVVEKLIAADPIDYGQDQGIVKQYLAKFLQDMAIVYRDHGIYNRSHLEVLQIFARGLVVDSMKIF
ncbi:glycosyltransferase family 2 protein [Paraburkholderia sp. A1RI_3L]|uniref:glycosyltransferase family 2 protein n=1 Tax=Paraburkholderia TaxID=1822464 RepID=UPI003B77F107